MRSRRAKRWAVVAWAVLVVGGGGLTLWLEDVTRQPPVGWSEPEPAPDPWPPVDATECPPPTPLPSPDEDGSFAWGCLVKR